MTLSPPIVTMHVDPDTGEFVAQSALGNGDQPQVVAVAADFEELGKQLSHWYLIVMTRQLPKAPGLPMRPEPTP